ncbi:MAG: ATP-binding cassette domain-containing protein, partial [Syntrophomonadaceae bacterium]|nr:ATP-binding cassette domain-containing protein [Syntrophomonadaceae bacterium]
KYFTMGETVKPLDKISFSVEAGDFAAIEGPSGIGKSTLLYTNAGLLEPSEGKISLFEKDMSRLSDKEKTRLRAEKIGFAFQEAILLQALTVKENLLFTQKYNNKKKDPAKIDYLLEKYGLTDRSKFLPYQLSVGQRRRLVMARALLNDPLLLLADEPSNDLNEEWIDIIMESLMDISKKGGAVIMVTHNRELAMQAGKRYYLQEGKLAEIN